MVTHAMKESELSTSALPGGDSEQSELLALTVNGPEDMCLNSPESDTVPNGGLSGKAANGSLLTGTVNEVYEGSIKEEDTLELSEKDHSDIVLTLDGNVIDELDDKEESLPVESLRAMAFQVFIPFLVAGFGTVAAGVVLEIVGEWPVFKTVSELYILVPSLLGLKGNLEMTLAARLSTQANLGHMGTTKEQLKMAYGNMVLIQCQATVVAFFASIFAVIIDSINAGKFDMNHAILLCASALVTASVASLLLGCVTVFVVILSLKCHINPDNVTTPIAASLGDVTTLALLASVSSLLFKTIYTDLWLPSALVVVFLLLVPVWAVLAKRNKYSQNVLYSGWVPIISAVFISSVGGCILDFAVTKFKGILVFQPVINGVGGNLVAVQASRISTYLHQRSEMGSLPANDPRACVNPCFAFFGKSAHSKTARVLLLMALPGHLIFVYVIRLLKAGNTSITFIFLLIYLSAALLQVALLLYIAYVMIQWMWKKKIDPDNSSIPLLTALGDLLGTSFLALAFLLLSYAGHKDAHDGN